MTTMFLACTSSVIHMSAKLPVMIPVCPSPEAAPMNGHRMCELVPPQTNSSIAGLSDWVVMPSIHEKGGKFC